MSVFSVSTYAKPIKGLRRRRTRFLGLSGPYALYGDQLDRARTALTLWKLANRRRRCHPEGGCPWAWHLRRAAICEFASSSSPS